MSERDLRDLAIPRDGDKQPRRRSALWIALLVAILIAGGGYFFLADRNGSAVVTVEVMTIPGGERAPAGSELVATGYIVARRISRVTCAVSDKIVKMTVDEGSAVQEGQLLAAVESGEIEAELSQEQTRFEKLKNEADRLKALYERKIVRFDELDAANLELDICRAKIEGLEQRLENTQIRSPFDGKIIEKLAEVGEMAPPGGVFVIADMSEPEVEVDIKESFINRLRPGLPVRVVPEAYPDRGYKGRVLRIVGQGNRGAGTIPVRLIIDNPDDALVHNMSAQVMFQLSAEKSTASASIILPKTAVRSVANNPTVYLLDGGFIRERSVNVRESSSGMVEVLTGLNAGDKIVLKPTDELRDGLPARVR